MSMFEEPKKTENSTSLLAEKLMSISEPDTLKNDGGELRGRFYFGDLENLLQEIINKIKKVMNEEKEDSELRSIPEGEYKKGYLMGYSDAIETLTNVYEALFSLQETQRRGN